MPRTAPGFDLDQGDQCPIPRAERSAQPWCAVTIGWIVALRRCPAEDTRTAGTVSATSTSRSTDALASRFIRSYATLTRQTDQSDVVLSYVGVTKAV